MTNQSRLIQTIRSEFKDKLQEESEISSKHVTSSIEIIRKGIIQMKSEYEELNESVNHNFKLTEERIAEL